MHNSDYLKWEKNLAEYWNSNLSFAEYCRVNNLKLKTASFWKRRFQRADVKSSLTSADIVPLPNETASVPCETSGICLTVGEVGIHLESDFNAACLRRILDLLENK